jgi:hypothetical protein
MRVGERCSTKGLGVIFIMTLTAQFQPAAADEPATNSSSESKAVDARRIEATPDLPQSQKELPRRGSKHCGPVSASNALAWLAAEGYPKLMPSDQLALAKELGSTDYMNTGDGTSAAGVMSGLRKYVKARGYAIQRLEFQGWRLIPRRFARVAGQADAARLAGELQTKSIVLINVGWYKKNGDDFERISGHWVTLVGAEPGETLRLVIHDPSSRSPQGDAERVAATRLESGKLTGGQNNGLPVDAAGAWELGGELKIKTSAGANAAVLDGAVVLQLK